MTKLSNSDSNGGGLTPAAVLKEVYESHRRNHHYSIRKKNPKIWIMNLAEMEKFSILVAQEAYDVYKESKQVDGKLPHPNYYMAICRRLAKKEGEKDVKQTWGKTI